MQAKLFFMLTTIWYLASPSRCCVSELRAYEASGIPVQMIRDSLFNRSTMVSSYHPRYRSASKACACNCEAVAVAGGQTGLET
ncbi:hypothetical protein DAI22_02g140300 [Oryza sativa Japonica Group]|nr:hypothetical protein DAI22_02g140300 [Oryza sativa Japonica Group]